MSTLLCTVQKRIAESLFDKHFDSQNVSSFSLKCERFVIVSSLIVINFVEIQGN